MTRFLALLTILANVGAISAFARCPQPDPLAPTLAFVLIALNLVAFEASAHRHTDHGPAPERAP